MNNRQKKILEQLTDEHRIDVSTLAERHRVSAVTMRKDLDLLEEMGLIRRMHGFAVISPRDNINNRLAYHYEDKHRIAHMAAESIAPGETIMIESGSCCALLAMELANAKRDVTIITNSGFIADYVRDRPRIRIVLLGGEYQPESQAMVGPLTARGSEMFCVDKLYIGTDGFSPRFGFTGEDMMRGEAVRAMRARANKLFILTESDKFARQGVVALMPFDQITGIYTDDRIPRPTESLLLEKRIDVFKA